MHSDPESAYGELRDDWGRLAGISLKQRQSRRDERASGSVSAPMYRQRPSTAGQPCCLNAARGSQSPPGTSVAACGAWLVGYFQVGTLTTKAEF